MRQFLAFLCAISLLPGAISPLSAEENAQASEKKQTDNSSAVQRNKLKDKNSQENLPADYYQQLGIPGITRPWAPLDYINAANILASLVKQTPQNLPHYSDAVGRSYMQHMVDGKNFYNTLQFANTHEQRLELITMYLDGVQRLFTIYQQALDAGKPYYAEWVDIIGLSSYLAALSQPEWNFYLQQSAQTPEYDQKIQAITLLQTALVNPVITGVQAIPRMSTPLAWRLLQQLNYSFPTYSASLPLDALEQLQQAFSQAYQQSQDARIREALKQLMSQLYTSAY